MDERLADHLTIEREHRGWSVADLAERSGVSRAMISKIERGEAKPTASLLSRIAGAFGLPLSILLARVEATHSRVSKASAQTRWTDPETGYVRLAISPPSDPMLQLTEIELPVGARVAFPASTFTFSHQQILVLDGRLTLHEGSEVRDLGAGDCVAFGPPSACVFENNTRKVCRYLVALVRRP